MIGAFVGLDRSSPVSGNIILALAAAMLATGVLGLSSSASRSARCAARTSGPAGHHDRRGHRAAGDRAVVFRSRAEGVSLEHRARAVGDAPAALSSVQVFILAAALGADGRRAPVPEPHARRPGRARDGGGAHRGRPARGQREGRRHADVLRGLHAGRRRGVLVGLAYNSVHPFIGVQMVIKGLVVMLLGAWAKSRAPCSAASCSASSRCSASRTWPRPTRYAFAFGAVVLILLVRPEGLLGLRVQRRD